MKTIYFNLLFASILLANCTTNTNTDKHQPVVVEKAFIHPTSKEYPSPMSFSKVVINMGIRGIDESEKNGKVYCENGQLIITVNGEITGERAITSIGVGVPLENDKYSYNYTLYYMGEILLTEFVDKDGIPYKYRFVLSGGWTEEFYAE